MKEIKVLEGKVVAPEGMKVGIVASRFNEIIVNKLLGGAVDGLVRHGVEEVIRGDTTHYDYVCSEVSKGIAQVGLAEKMPVLFGVLTTENIEQAIARAGSKGGNKGYDCALSAIEMVNLMRQF